MSFKELNSRRVDPSLVRQSVVHYLADPERLTTMQFANLGMASSRHCDIHLTMEVCEQVGVDGSGWCSATLSTQERGILHGGRSFRGVWCFVDGRTSECVLMDARQRKAGTREKGLFLWRLLYIIL